MRLHRWRVYLNPFDFSGNYTSFQDVTSDVEMAQVGSLDQALDNTDYDIGVLRTNSFELSFRNESGKYLDVDSSYSMFKYKRGDTLCKLTYEIEEDGPYAGIAPAGESYLSVETELFTGLLNDDTATMDLDSQRITFAVIGREAILDRVIVPFGLIADGDLVSSVIYKCLNQTAVTNLLTVSTGNISLGVDTALDSVADLQNKTVKDALSDLLLISNSVLYVANNAIYIAPRTASTTTKYNFYGQASNAGPENIQNIKAIQSGLSRVFNYLNWSPSQATTFDATSVTKYGVIQKQFDQTYVTDSTKQLNILTSILNEFKNPKQEFDLYTPVDYSTLALSLLDKVMVDYPTVVYQTGSNFPICGAVICGLGVLPTLLWAFSISNASGYKITGKSIQVKDDLCKFRLRAI